MEVDGAPDLTDFMNDWFFGTVGARHSGGGYYLTGESSKRPASPAGKNKQEKSGGGSASKQTQDWLEVGLGIRFFGYVRFGLIGVSKLRFTKN